MPDTALKHVAYEQEGRIGTLVFVPGKVEGIAARNEWRQWLDAHQDDIPNAMMLVNVGDLEPATLIPLVLSLSELGCEIICIGWSEDEGRYRLVFDSNGAITEETFPADVWVDDKLAVLK